jgi:hypothetical protein
MDLDLDGGSGSLVHWLWIIAHEQQDGGIEI